jgi:hypothetical protein
MPNPWLEIPLGEYEAHMAHPAIDQARLLAEELRGILRTYRPHSVAIVGAAGGNGLDQIDASVTTRTVAVDINPAYAAELERRYAYRLPGLEVHVADVEYSKLHVPPVEFVYAALLLEYVDLHRGLAGLRALCAPLGLLAIVTQLPSRFVAPVTPSPYSSLQRLVPSMQLVSSESLEAAARRLGFSLQASHQVSSAAGKSFVVHVFQLAI